MLYNYTLKTEIDLIELEELELEVEIINQLENSKEPSKECLNSIMQFGAAFNSHTSSIINDVSYLAN
jgi:hypothetical protein